MKGEQIAAIEDLLLRVPAPIVIDHLGVLGQPNPLDNPWFKTISKLIDKGNCGLSCRALIWKARWGHRVIPTWRRLPEPISKLPLSEWCGEAFGRIRLKRKCRMTQSCLIC
jgi:hypothetical protein